MVACKQSLILAGSALRIAARCGRGSSTRAISLQYLPSFNIYVTFGQALCWRTSSYGRSDVARVMPPPISQKKAQIKGGQRAVRSTPTQRDTSPMNEAVAELQIFPPSCTAFSAILTHFPNATPPQPLTKQPAVLSSTTLQQLPRPRRKNEVVIMESYRQKWVRDIKMCGGDIS